MGWFMQHAYVTRQSIDYARLLDYVYWSFMHSLYVTSGSLQWNKEILQ